MNMFYSQENRQVDTQIHSAHICSCGPLYKCRCPSECTYSRAPSTQTEIPQKRSRHLWSGLLSAVLVVPQCDSWACNNVMEPNRAGCGGYDIFLLSPLFTVCVCVCVIGYRSGGGNRWLSTGAEETFHQASSYTQPDIQIYTHRAQENALRNPFERSRSLWSRLVITILAIKQDVINPMLWQMHIVSGHSCKLRSTNIFS